MKRFKAYLAQEFRMVKESKEINELKDELLANLVDKYEAYKQKGYSDDKAFVESIKSIGDLDEVLAQYVVNNQPIINLEFENTINKFKKMNIVAYALLLIGFILFIALTIWKNMYIGILGQSILVIISIIFFLLGFFDLKTPTNKMNELNRENAYIRGIKLSAHALFYYLLFVLLSLTFVYPSLSNHDKLRTYVPLIDIIISGGLYLIINTYYKKLLSSYVPFNIKLKPYLYGLAIFTGLFFMDVFLATALFIAYAFYEIVYVKSHVKSLLINKILLSLFIIYGFIYEYVWIKYDVSLEFDITDELSSLILLVIVLTAYTLYHLINGLYKIKTKSSISRKFYQFNYYAFLFYFVGLIIGTILYYTKFNFFYIILLLVDLELRQYIDRKL